MASEEGHPVDLYIYDLSNGLASVLAPTLIGRSVEGVWHTAVVVYGREYFYGAQGITSCAPGGTQLGPPHEVKRLGTTFVPHALFTEYLLGLSTSTYTGAAYRLLEHNCNTFSEEVCVFLCGAHVPKHILLQPQQLPPPLRLALSALLDSLLPAPAPNNSQPRGPRPVPTAPAYSYKPKPIVLKPFPLAGAAPPTRERPGARPSRPPLAAPAPAPPTPGRAPLHTLVSGSPWGFAATDGVRSARGESPDFLTLNQQVEQARAEGAALERRRSTLAEKLARKEKRREKKRHKLGLPPPSPPANAGTADNAEGAMADGVEVERPGPSAGAVPGSALEDPDERHEREMKRRLADPPIVYKDIDGAAEFEKLSALLSEKSLAESERQSLDELQQYLVQGEGSWVLGDDFLAFIGRILSDEQLVEARAAALRCLAACALREDVALLLHQDRRHHALLSYANNIDLHPPNEQLALALFMCNLFENVSSSEWLLYISEWESPSGQPLSNIRATTKVCVHCALGEGELREYGTALMHNVATKERLSVCTGLRARLPAHALCKVFDEVCAELGMALLQLLAWAPAEEHMWRALKALARLAQHSTDVPQLIAMVGPDPSAFKGTSPRVDEQIDLIAARLK